MNRKIKISDFILGQLREGLDNNEISLEDHFFEMGADSVVIVRLRQEVEDQCYVDIPIEDFLNGNIASVGDLVEYVSSHAPGEAPLFGTENEETEEEGIGDTDTLTF